MCLTCALRGIEVFTEVGLERRFSDSYYEHLADYLAGYGPHFVGEVLDHTRLSMRPVQMQRKHLENLLESEYVKIESFSKWRISIASLDHAIDKQFSPTYDVANVEHMYGNHGTLCYPNVTEEYIKNRILFRYNLMYVGGASLKSFLQKWAKGITRTLRLEIPDAVERGSKHI